MMIGLEGRSTGWLCFGYEKGAVSTDIPLPSYDRLLITLNRYGFFFGNTWTIGDGDE